MFIFAFGMKRPKTTADINLSRIAAVQNHINLHYREELKLSELAQLVCLAPTSLCHIFKSHTGMTVSKYITDVRIRHATEMLQNSDDSIKAIAFECGFSTLSNFNRLFYRVTGMTPSAYREQNNIQRL